MILYMYAAINLLCFTFSMVFKLWFAQTWTFKKGTSVDKLKLQFINFNFQYENLRNTHLNELFNDAFSIDAIYLLMERF